MFWFLWDRNLPATEAAKKFASTRASAGLSFYDLGVATEKTPPPFVQETLVLASRGTFTGLKAHQEARDAVAGYLERFLGIPARNNVFVLPANARAGLKRAFSFMSRKAAGKEIQIVLPHHSWTLYASLLSESFSPDRDHHVYFRHPLPEDTVLGHDIRILLHHAPSLVITNSPVNPSGLVLSDSWLQGLAWELESVNRIGRQTALHVFDVVNFNAFPQRPREKTGPYLVSNLAPIAHPDAKTPWIGVIGFSKALAIQGVLPDSLGLTALVVNPRHAKEFASVLEENAQEENRVWFYDWVARVFDRGMDHYHLDHFAGTYEKYRINRAVLETGFREEVVPGNPSATALLTLHDVRGRTVRCQGKLLVLATSADLAEYLGNHGLVVVPEKSEGRTLNIRLSLTQETKIFAEAVDMLCKLVNKDIRGSFKPVNPLAPGKLRSSLHLFA